MGNRKVLISGAGVAGPTLAYWLLRYGFEPTLIERAPALRTGGYVIDFWGLGFDVADKMGLVPGLRGLGYTIEEVRIVNHRGKRVGGFDISSFQRIMKGRYLSILRSDLSHLIYEALGGRVRTIFGDSIEGIEQDQDGVDVSFGHAPPERCDIVIGAGGLHSPVRDIVFGPEEHYEKYLDCYAASFSVDHYPHKDPHAYVTYTAPGRQISRYALRGDRTAFFFVFAKDSKLSIGHQDLDAQKRVLREAFGRDGWECPEILHALESTSDLYFDSVSQIRMGQWSKGRVSLVGDACSCPSLLAGQGAAQAMAAAYVLAGELHRAEGDYATAFRRYEDRFRLFTASKQQSAETFARSFAPKTRFGLFARNQATRLFALPFATDLMMGRLLKDALVLPNYEAA